MWSAVLHLTNVEWRLNHIAMGRFVGQVSSVQVTASSRWTPTVPEHSNNDVLRIVPPVVEPISQQGGRLFRAARRYETPERPDHPSTSDGPSCRQNAHAPLLLVKNNRTGSRISSETSRARTHALTNTITSHVGDGVYNVCRACSTAVNHFEWAERMFRAGISLVPFCSIRRNHLLSQ